MPRRRQPEATRRRLLHAAFREFHRNGFHSADLGAILSYARVTKGALYHHFQSKTGLGYAVVEEVLGEWIYDRWLHPVVQSDDPIKALIDLAAWASRHSTPESLALGCPLNNLAQELSATDNGFRQRLGAIYSAWRRGLEQTLNRAKERGFVRLDIDSVAAAAFIVAGWEGSIGLSKTDPDPATVDACRRGIEGYLQSLRP